MPTVEYFCQCNQASPAPPPPHLPSSAYSFHPLPALFFCEECDAVRCDSCALVEVSGYYCPNCLFEVPSASVRGEKNRCARNCFMCPICTNTLSVVASDPPEDGEGARTGPSASVGEPPFFLYCNHCRWDSAEAGVTFEKPTGLAAQLQKHEDTAPDALEFERLKDHFEPLLRPPTTAGTTGGAGPKFPSPTNNPIQAAASQALSRDIPGVPRYNPLNRSMRREKAVAKDDLNEYRARLDVVTVGAGGEVEVDLLRGLERVEDVASLEQRWGSSWATGLRTRDLRPHRIPLQTKKTKRCATCKHILIKPEQKAQSVRYKIKLVAANYLPAITASLVTLSRNAPSVLHAGGTYPFALSFTNPLYDQIQIRITTQRVGTSQTRPPFAITLPPAPFMVAAFAEAWEYEDDEEMEEEGAYADVRSREGGAARGKTVGVLERKANVTVVGGEAIIGKSSRGNLKFNMLVSYTYRSDDPMDEEDDPTASPSKSKGVDMKTFSFSVVIDFGAIVAKEEEAMDTS